jgi:hypothetical protein
MPKERLARDSDKAAWRAGLGQPAWLQPSYQAL